MFLTCSHLFPEALAPSVREVGLGDLVMAGKERWRRHVLALDLEGFPKSWIQRGLQEIHHPNDNMDGRMDACLGYTAVLGAKIFESMGELWEDLREDQKKSVRTDLANRPTEPMLVSYDSRYTKLWGNCGFSEWVETDHSRTCWRNLRLRNIRSSGR